MEGPAAGEPEAPDEVLLQVVERHARIVCGDGDVVEVSVAHDSILVPAEHRVQRLRELAAAGLVDAAGIKPGPFIPFRPRERTEAADLLWGDG